MHQVIPQDPVNSPLDSIRELLQQGDSEEAHTQVNVWLEQKPHDVEAIILKAEICLVRERDLSFVTNVLKSGADDSAPFAKLHARVDRLIQSKLTEGRRSLRQRSVRNALGDFHIAVTLALADPAVSLAAGMALLQAADDYREGESSKPLDILAGLMKPLTAETDQFEAVEKYLSLALEHSEPGESVYRSAVEHLVRHWLRQRQIDQALTFLASASWPGSEGDALCQEAGQHVLVTGLSVASVLLRSGQIEAADTLLMECAEAAPDFPLIPLFQAESHRLKGSLLPALEAFKRVIAAADKPFPGIAFEHATELWQATQHIHVTCPSCGKVSGVPVMRCAFCDTAVGQHELLPDRYLMDGISETQIARIGLAQVFAATGDLPQAIREIETVLSSIPPDRAVVRSLQTLRGEWIWQMESQSRVDLAHQAVDMVEQLGLTMEAQAMIALASEAMPAAWATVEQKRRLDLANRLLRAGDLATAGKLLTAAFTSPTEATIAKRLHQRLNRAIHQRAEELLRQGQIALSAEQFDQAIELAEAALILKPHDVAAHLLRGQAYLQSAQILPAITDFRAILAAADNHALLRAARIGAACALEVHHDLDEAFTILGKDNHPEVAAVRERLRRRQNGEPVIRVERVDTMVMHDTLQRVQADTHCLGIFAVMVTAISRPWSAGQDGWRERLLNASFEFVQVLGGLRNVAGDPIFSLRFISYPHARLPERGQLKVALLVRITANDETSSHALALDLWQMVVDIMPSAHEHIYRVEPVVDEAELEKLLIPFEMTTAAEIVRREDVPLKDDDRYAVYPFTAGTIDLHNLCWALLRHKTPAIVSIQLLPTDLMAVESAALNGMMLNTSEPVAEPVGESSLTPANLDLVSQWWNGAARWGQAQANRYALDSLRMHAYVLRVSVAASSGASMLLPEIVASALFGSVQPRGGALFGGYEVVRAEDPEELAIAGRNIREIDVEGWVYSAAPTGMERLRYLVGEQEAAVVFRFPLPGPQGVPGIATIEARPVAPPTGLPDRGVVLGESITRAGGMPLRILQANSDRRRHTYIVGKTGVGKSTLMQKMALQDIQAGHGVCLVDPHGDLVEDILARIPPHRVGDVILFDPSDEERPVGLNLLEARSETEKHRIVTEFIGLLFHMYDPNKTGIVGPRFEHNVRNAMLTVMSVEGSTLIEVVRALTDIQYVRSLMPNVTDPLVRSYWEKQIANTSDFHKSEILDYIVSKFSRFVGDRLVRNIVGQRQTTLNFREIMDQRKILLVNLSKGKIGPECAQFVGLLLVQRFLLTALSRANMPAESRPDFFLYVDEFQNFATEMFGTLLSEGRKYGVAVIIANQYLTQLDRNIRDAIFGNVGTIISFRLGNQDAAVLSPEMYPTFGPDDLVNLPRFTACAKLLVDGIAARPFTMRTLPDTRLPNQALAQAIRQTSRQIYGRDADTITKDVMARFST